MQVAECRFDPGGTDLKSKFVFKTLFSSEPKAAQDGGIEEQSFLFSSTFYPLDNIHTQGYLEGLYPMPTVKRD